LGGLAKEVGWASLPAALTRVLLHIRGGRSLELKGATAQTLLFIEQNQYASSPGFNIDFFFLPIIGEVLKYLFSNFTLSF